MTAKENTMPRWNTTSTDPLFSGSLVRCTKCNEPLTGHAIRMLELDQRTQTYHDNGDVPEDRSQGWFPFGLKCAKREIAKARS
jgi:hypothetical protein